MKTLLVGFLIALTCFGQQRTNIAVSEYPSDGPTEFYDYDGSNNLIYICRARPVPIAQQDNSKYALSITKAATTLTNIAVSSNTATLTSASAHGLRPGNLITVSGGTVDTDLNGTYIILTVPSTTTLTFTTANVSDATYTDATLAVSVTATPLLTSAIWSIERFTYNASSRVTDKQWANGNRQDYSNICANRAVTTGATKITYK